MSIPSAKYLKKKASNRLQSGNDPKKVVLVYAGIVALSSLVVTVVQDLLDSQISQTGGIQNIGTRSMLTTADTVLTIAQLLLVMCLTLGYTGSMLRIARGQYASPNSLKAGGERIWVLLRTRLLQMLIMTAAAFALCFLVVNVCLLTPLSNRMIAVMGTVSAEELLSNGLALMGLYSAMLPIMLIYLVALVPLLWYFSCTYRMADYLLIDRPQLGAFGVLRESRRMMQGNMKMMLRVDLSFWWYYLLQALVSVLIYLNMVLAPFAIGLPPAVLYWGTVVLYLAADFALRYFFSNKVAVTYALFYDSLCPKQEQSGAVLGNIFQM
jgi:membrane protein